MKALHKQLSALLLAMVLVLTGTVPAAAKDSSQQNNPAVLTEDSGTGSPSSPEDADDPADTETSSESRNGTADSQASSADSGDASEDSEVQAESADDGDVPETEPSAPAAEFLYAELSQDGSTQGIVVKLDTEQTLEAASLTYSDNGQTASADASQIIDNYAAFFLPAGENRTFVSMDSVIQGSAFTTDLSPLEDGQTLDYAQLADSENQADSYSLDDSQEAEEIQESVLTVDLDEEISGEDIASAAASSSKARSASAAKAGQTRVIVLDPGHGRAGTGTYRDWGDFVLDEAVINFKISQYTKEALEENYSNIKVYLTKTSQNENPSISERVDFAVEKNADILVSQHVNATTETTTTAHGVVAMVPRVDSDHPYHADTAKEAQELARNILDELVELGFNDMGFQTPLSQTGDTYEDGSLADYYGIVRYSRKANLPGVIIEHGFVNNREDALKLNNETMLKRIGQADARGIAAYLGLKEKDPSNPTVTPTPTTTPTPTPPPSSSGYTGWKQTGGSWYYYSNGQKTTGWQKVKGSWYYMNSSGVMLTGWQKISGIWYYMDGSGHMLTGWQKIGGIWYYMDGSGHMLTGWQKIGGIWYYMDGSGHMLTGWQKIGGIWYYMDGSGHMLTGWQRINNKWYYMNSSGHMLTGWQYLGSHWFYMNSSGHMLTGWQHLGGKWYYMNSSGYMLTGWQKISGIWYYMNGSGHMLTGWQKISGIWYYMDGSGHMLTGWQKIGGIWYYMDGSGHMLTGWQKIGGIWYYMDGSGHMLTGWQKIGGIWYYMDGSGHMLTGWQKINGQWYYMDASGRMAANTWIGSYYVNGSGVWVQTPASSGTSGSGDKMIAIDAGHQRKGDSSKEPVGPGSSIMKAKVASGTYGKWSGLNEYELTLQVSQKLKTELINRGYQVYMIRENHDVNISNAQRAKNAASAGADLLVRIHANGDNNSSVHGALTMAPSDSNPYLSSSLISSSQKLSDCIVSSLCASTGAQNRGVMTTDSMSGINWSTIPVSIVEMGFMTNRTEDLNMASVSYQQKIAQGIADGIDQYYS